MSIKKFAESKVISIANLAAGNFQSYPVELNTDYDRCTGISIIAVNNGGDPNARIGVSKSGQAIESPTPLPNWQFATSLPSRDRYRPFDFSIKSQDIKLQVEPFKDVSGAEYVVTFILERDEA